MAHRSYLVRFAQRKLQDPSLAEDVVHDVFEAVLSRPRRFAGQSALRSWLTGVLKHKIVDLVRQRRCMQSLDDEADDGEAWPWNARSRAPTRLPSSASCCARRCSASRRCPAACAT